MHWLFYSICYCSNLNGLDLEYNIEGNSVMRRVVKYEYIIILFVFLNENVVYAFLMSIKIS